MDAVDLGGRRAGIGWQRIGLLSAMLEQDIALRFDLDVFVYGSHFIV